MNPAIYISDEEAAELRHFIINYRGETGADLAMLKRLSEEVERAGPLPETGGRKPVTVNSEVTVRFSDGDEMTCCPVFPEYASLEEGRISILAPMGIALLGALEGDEVEWTTRAGTMRARVLKINNPTNHE